MEQKDPLKEDFRKFLWLVWKHIELPDPTPLQYDMANYLQNGPNKVCIEAFRGCGKSFVTSAYVLWELYKDPQKKIMVVSASKNRADNFTTFTMRLLLEMPVLAHLKPRAEQRQSKIEFDVGPAVPDQSPSVRSLGITSQLTGSRADIIVSDDVEVVNNSMTSDMREKLLERTKEYSAILKPLPSAKIIYLGTPQTQDSIYNKLPSTFAKRIWPALVPTKSQMAVYSNDLAPFIRKMYERGQSGEPSDPERFDKADLIDREAEYGKAGFQLQFMLNTQLSDMEKFPLKVKDLLIMPTEVSKAPMEINWLPHPDRMIKDIPNLAMAGDYMYAVAGHSNMFSEYTGSVLSVDPSGRGRDETGYAVVKYINGYLVVRRCGGLPGGYDDQTLEELAKIARDEEVNYVITESNFGDGMFNKLFQPVLLKYHKCALEEVRHSKQKEVRMIDTLEPVMMRHKLVIDPEVLKEDFESVQKYESSVKVEKSLVYQMTRLCAERGALKHDDRVDALSIAVSYFTEIMARDEKLGVKRKREADMMVELKKYQKNALRGASSGASRGNFSGAVRAKWNSVY